MIGALVLWTYFSMGIMNVGIPNVGIMNISRKVLLNTFDNIFWYFWYHLGVEARLVAKNESLGAPLPSKVGPAPREHRFAPKFYFSFLYELSGSQKPSWIWSVVLWSVSVATSCSPQRPPPHYWCEWCFVEKGGPPISWSGGDQHQVDNSAGRNLPENFKIRNFRWNVRRDFSTFLNWTQPVLSSMALMVATTSPLSAAVNSERASNA